MASVSAAAANSFKDKTFTTSTDDQGKNYAQHRPNYHPSVYEHIVDHHKATGGKFDSLLDVGCGPGLATFSLAPHFTHARGIDPSPAMISTAQSLNTFPETITFHTSPAEDMSAIPTSSVDLITAANAAHWFDLPRFWSEAARVLKPGGSVALWATMRAVTHPDLPNAGKIETALSRHREEYLAPFKVEGNLMSQDGYKHLAMPWAIDPPINGFNKSSFNRRIWEPDERFLAGEDAYSLDDFEKTMGTMSPVVRWREANPEKVGTEEDVVRVLRNEIEGLLREGGVQDLVLRGRVPGAVLMLKKG
ncbi:hypothetical protein PRZ48_003989 [Zasmidium cellare]|uniref:Methyltransferase type 11 domain-containing protein n=1 Tax=Zasmidium cellare TaxID=395010 RepID=A0ABR0EXD8_ZASCE|nr:hypothetical protein PRZ48_003989 [Zasmidium cellare]